MLWFCLTALALTLLVGILGFFAWGLGQVLHKLSGVLVPMVFALILAYILDPVVEFFQRKHLRRIWAVSLVFTLAALLMAAVLGSVLPGLRRESRKLIDDLPKTSETVRVKLNAFLNDTAIGRQLPNSWREPLQSAVVQSAPAPRKEPTLTSPDFPSPVIIQCHQCHQCHQRRRTRLQRNRARTPAGIQRRGPARACQRGEFPGKMVLRAIEQTLHLG